MMTKWISVKDRLPEERQSCLAYTKEGQMHTCWASYWHGSVREFAGFTFPLDEMGESGVTHWMPLPSPPPSE